MIAVDTNILVYAHRIDSPWHPAAEKCVRELAEGRESWAVPWPCVHEFFSIVTHPRIYDPPTPPAAALDQIDAWLESPSLVLLAESPAYWTVLKSVLSRSGVRGPRVHDGRIAALCREHGVRELWSTDRDFTRFAEIKTRNPLL